MIHRWGRLSAGLLLRPRVAPRHCSSCAKSSNARRQVEGKSLITFFYDATRHEARASARRVDRSIVDFEDSAPRSSAFLFVLRSYNLVLTARYKAHNLRLSEVAGSSLQRHPISSFILSPLFPNATSVLVSALLLHRLPPHTYLYALLAEFNPHRSPARPRAPIAQALPRAPSLRCTGRLCART